MLSYKLLTPGPLTTSAQVKNAMQVDHCTWDDDYKNITQKIRQDLLQLALVDEHDYTAILMQGSGTFGVESVLTSIVAPYEKVLVLSNGVYGERIVQILEYTKLAFHGIKKPYNTSFNANEVAEILKEDSQIAHVVMVHCETTTGILNDIQAIGNVAHEFGVNFIVDAMSSFGGIEIPMKDWHIGYLISSANKCIQGVPGFSFVIAKRAHIQTTKGYAKSLSLDLYNQWVSMEKDGKWRFTSPTHTVLAFAQALKELHDEGGVAARFQRYVKNNRLMREALKQAGIEAYLPLLLQSPFITTFLYPQDDFDFPSFYHYVKERGFAIYPGKLTNINTFRLGNMGEIYPEDVLKVGEIIQQYMGEYINHGTN